jgi:hypothetical protein
MGVTLMFRFECRLFSCPFLRLSPLKSLFEFSFVTIVVGDFSSIWIFGGLPIFFNDNINYLKTQLLDFIITITFSFGIFLSIYSFFAWLLKKEQFHFSD